ncbi:MAG: hypothetical protein V4760_10950 [Bdellovibrionota bacterium]
MNNDQKVATRTFLAIALAIAALAWVSTANASATKVGNGDDGGDLEGARKIENGILVQTRKKAIDLLKRLDTAAIEHLGNLQPELEKSEMYLVARDSAAKLDEDKGLESTPDGSAVYARTFAEPHAATRFFPAALTLNEDQLIALHVHEALHRSLPPSVREDEKIVTKITLALTAPDATVDRVRRVVTTEIRQDARSISNGGAGGDGTLEARLPKGPQAPPLENPSSVTYTFRTFSIADKDKAAVPLESMHSIQSFLYPFGEGSHALGLGIEASYLKAGEEAYMGPLELSARMKLTTIRGFDVGGFLNYSMNSMAPDEFKNSPLGRDIVTAGLAMKRVTPRYYVENSISISDDGDAKQKLGQIEYTHHYGQITSAAVRAGGRLRGFELGGLLEIVLADSHVVKGGAFKRDFGRQRLVTAGPEASYTFGDLKLGLAAQLLLDSTNGTKLDDLGDIMGRGVGQGSVSSSLSLRF